MTELAVSVRLKADGSGLVGQLRVAEAEMNKFGQATALAGGKAQVFTTGTAAAAKGVRELGDAQRQATGTSASMGTEAGELAAKLGTLTQINTSLRARVKDADAATAGLSQQLQQLQVASGVAGEIGALSAALGACVGGLGAATQAIDRLAAG